MRLNRSFHHTLLRLCGWYLPFVVAGIVLGQVWMAIAIASIAVVAWHYLRLHRLLDAAIHDRWFPAPEGWGIWSELESQLHRRQRESRRRRARLVELLQEIREAASALPDAVLILARRDRRILWFNESGSRLLGLRYPGDLGKSLTHLVRAPRVREWIDSEPRDDSLGEVRSPVDENLRLSFRLVEYSADQALLVVRDVTRLSRLEQVRRDFVANVSHELRTPLTVVHGYLDLLDAEAHPEWEPMFAEMRRQSARMTQLVEDLLTLSRLESQDAPVTERVAMAPMLASLRREAMALSQGRHQVEAHDRADLDLLGSAKDLHSAFSNLVSNAVRYTPEGGRIEITLEAAADGGATLAVRDTGRGIPAQHIPRIVERFYRVSTSRSRETGGTGLGLSIVKHVLGLHRARLEVESEVGRGSVFRAHFDADHVLAREGDDAGLQDIA
ncbi:MAG TPA: phosphate regulon sensor histidine kinase PhoR [Xanthomonadaceae bacterium]|nr:phosphate regulon sensor histidine kinase PhoR [Xanthomonadaceae bacterium]